MTGASPTTFGAWVLILVTQLVASGGDVLGQRTVRVIHNNSRRRMIISFVIVSALQMFLVLGLLQAVLPTSVTGAIYQGTSALTCYKEYDLDGCCPKHGPSCPCVVTCAVANSTCTAIPCPAQGPFSMFRSIGHHPFLLLIGPANVAFYVAESAVYCEPIGLLLLVVASISASVFIQPFSWVFGLPTKSVSAGIIILGVFGALLCGIERAHGAVSRAMGLGGGNRLLNGTASSAAAADDQYDDEEAEDEEDEVVHVADGEAMAIWKRRGPRSPYVPWGSVHCHLLIPVACTVVIAMCYCLWFVLMGDFNDLYRVNPWGFNAIDQVTLPVFAYAFIFLLDLWPTSRRILDIDSHMSAAASFRLAFKELFATKSSFVTVFFYRFIINARAMVFSYLALWYDLNVIYLELTLVKIVIAWLMTLLVTRLLPSVIHTTPEERKRAGDMKFLIVKVLGTAAVLASLLLLNRAA